MATDSRTTFPSHVDDHAKKLRIIKFDGGSALVAWSGYTAFAVDTVDVLEKESASLKPTHYRDFAELAKQVVDKTRTREIAPYRGALISVDSVQSHLRDNMQFNLMMAYYFRNQPCLYMLGFPSGSIYREQAHFATEGQNASLAAYLLKEYTQPDMDKKLATAIAVYVIEAIAEHDKTVGGLARVAVLRSPSTFSGWSERPLPERVLAEGVSQYVPLPDYSPQAHQLPDDNVRDIAAITTQVRAWIRRRHTKQLKDRLDRESRKEIEKMMGDLFADGMKPPGIKGYRKKAALG